MKRWNRWQQMTFLEQLGQLLANGYQLPLALDLVGSLIPVLKKDLVVCQQRLEQGDTLAESLNPYLRPLLCEQLALSQLHGQQTALLIALGKRDRLVYQQRQKMRQLLLYPCFLLLTLGLLFAVMMVFLLPHLQTLGHVQAGLPDWVNVTGVMLLSLLLLGMMMGVCLIRRYQLNWLKVGRRLPIVGAYFRLSIDYHLCLQVGYIMQSGVSLAAVVYYCQHFSHLVFSNLIGTSVHDAFNRGASLSQALQEVDGLSLAARQLFMKGKPQEEVGADLIMYSQMLVERMERLVNQWLGCLQPLAFIVIGICVIGLYCWLLLPLYQNIGGMTTW